MGRTFGGTNISKMFQCRSDALPLDQQDLSKQSTRQSIDTTSKERKRDLPEIDKLDFRKHSLRFPACEIREVHGNTELYQCAGTRTPRSHAPLSWQREWTQSVVVFAYFRLFVFSLRNFSCWNGWPCHVSHFGFPCWPGLTWGREMQPSLLLYFAFKRVHLFKRMFQARLVKTGHNPFCPPLEILKALTAVNWVV